MKSPKPILPLIIIESPYASPTANGLKQNILYARLCMRDSISRSEAPFASHLLYTQPSILNDLDANERALGILLGFSWSSAAQLHAFYTDLGWSNGMEGALKFCAHEQKPIELRSLKDNVILPPAEELKDVRYTISQGR